MVKYRLIYFDFKGRGELIRMVFKASGQEFEDKRIEYSPTSSEWLKYKPLTPFHKLPVLEIIDDDEEKNVEDEDNNDNEEENNNESKVKRLAQSITIARYLANKFNLVGEDEWEKAEADSYADQITELADKIVEFHLETDAENQKKLSANLENQIVPEYMKIFEAKIAEMNTGYLVSKKLTWTDLWLGENMKKETLEKFPIIREHDEKLKSNRNISEWLSIRPDSKY